MPCHNGAMNAPGAPPAEPANAWNTRDLAAVLIAVVGLWVVVDFLLRTFTDLRQSWRRDADWWLETWLAGLFGAVLLCTSRRLAGLLFRVRISGPPPGEIVGVLSAAIAVVGLVVAFDRMAALVEVVTANLAWDESDSIPVYAVAGHLGFAGFGGLLFAKSGMFARWWGRWNPS